VPVDPSPDPASFDRKDCSLILLEIGFCRDLGCQDKLTKKIEKYNPLLCALRRYIGNIDLVCIPIGYSGTTLQNTAVVIATALAKARPSIDNKGKSKNLKTEERR